MTRGWPRILVVALVVLGGCKAAREYAEKQYDERRAIEKAEEHAAEERAVHEEAERPAPPKPAGSGLAPGAYRIVDVHVVAFGTNRKGKAWDDGRGAEPDLTVKIKVDGDAVGTCEGKQDAVNAHCVLDLEVELRAASLIELEVMDRDAFADDAVGTATLAEPATWGTRMEMQLVPTSRIESATIVLARPPTWWDLHGSRVIGFGAGIGLALVVVGLFRRSLLPATTLAKRVSL